MGLRFIYGTAGTGKSEFCFNEIKNNIKNKEKIYIITPEQFSYSAEKKLLEEINTNASVNAEVISFNRIANRVFTEVGGANEVLISKSSKAMLIYSILEKEKKNLKFLNSSDDNIDIILKEITEFKKHNITTLNIEEENTIGSDITLLKGYVILYDNNKIVGTTDFEISDIKNNSKFNIDVKLPSTLVINDNEESLLEYDKIEIYYTFAY